MSESYALSAERVEQDRNPDRRSLRAVGADEYVPETEAYVRSCPSCGTQGALHLDDCPPDPWWCICGRPLRPDETEPCDHCIAERDQKRRE